MEGATKARGGWPAIIFTPRPPSPSREEYSKYPVARCSKLQGCACILRRRRSARVYSQRREEREGDGATEINSPMYVYTSVCTYMRVYIAIVPCFHSFAERSKELCRRGIKSLNDATMKEGSIGTRNCTVNTEKNVVTGRRRSWGGPRA